MGQVANFKTECGLDLDRFLMAINSNLKSSIVVKEIEEVPEEFHSRYSCKRKTYRYVINNNCVSSAIFRNLEFFMPKKLDLAKMQRAVKFFEGTHDFAGFKASGTSQKSSVRTIYEGKVFEKDNRIFVELTGNGFLYNMVRIIAGTLVDVGLRED